MPEGAPQLSEATQIEVAMQKIRNDIATIPQERIVSFTELENDTMAAKRVYLELEHRVLEERLNALKK